MSVGLGMRLRRASMREQRTRHVKSSDVDPSRLWMTRDRLQSRWFEILSCFIVFVTLRPCSS